MTEVEELEFKLKCREDELSELQHLYNELNDFSNSQCAKLLQENARLKSENDSLKGYKSIQKKIWDMFGTFAELKALYEETYGEKVENRE